MKFVIQRTLKAQVFINNKLYSKIGKGILVLIGIDGNDQESTLDYYVRKIVNMRIFNDDQGLMNYSLLDIKGQILVVSQFTLLANTKKGNRPSYISAAKSKFAHHMYNQFINKLKGYEINVEKGRFGAHMKLDIINDGPVTILLGDND